jgi:hypothetical protein
MGFLSKIRNNMQNKVSKMPRSDMGFRDMGPGNMLRRPSLDFLEGRMPKRGGGFGNLGEAIRRMQEQGGMGMPRMEGSTDMGMPRMNFGDQIGYTRPNKNPSMPIAFNDPSFRMIGTPQPIARRDPSALERLPMGGAPSFNPTIFGQPIPQGADFSNMPNFSQIDMSQLDLSGIPQSISQMNLPQMPEGLPSMEEIQGNRRMPQMDRGRMQPRQMMAEGDEVIQSLDQKINNLLISRGYPMDVIADLTPREKLEDVMRQNDGSLAPEEIAAYASANPKNYMPQKPKFGLMAKAMEGGRTISDMDRQIGMMYGGEMKRYANGGEIENMLSGMDSGEQEAMGELEQMAPEMEMIDQLVMMVAQMIQQGAGEEQVISFLREQGLDDEDIGTVLQLVAEMAETEEVAAQNEIGADLEQLG